METIVKICKKHGKLTAEQCMSEKSARLSGGLYYRCRLCRDDKRMVYITNARIKTCKVHGLLKEEDIRIAGRTLGCRICHRATAGTARNIDRTKANIWNRMDRLKNPERYKEAERKYRATENALLKRIDGHNRRSFNLTHDEYHGMLKEQDNRCKICGEKETRKSAKTGKTLRLCVDHCHKTNIVRGLLCHGCNVSLGKMKDSPELLFNAILYLESFETE